jgi:TetR/AcrR family transcriptional regulator, tetracycline repressor protein
MVRPSIARRPRPKPPALTREHIVATAARLLEREGYEALTMRSLARELGIQAASLYWHVADREELEDLIFEALLADLELVVVGGDWREDLRSLARQLLAYLTAKRDVQRIIAGRFVLGPHLLRHLERILGVLQRGGLDGRDAAYALYTLLTYVNGFVLFQSNPCPRRRAARGAQATARAAGRPAPGPLPPQRSACRRAYCRRPGGSLRFRARPADRWARHARPRRGAASGSSPPLA